MNAQEDRIKRKKELLDEIESLDAQLRQLEVDRKKLEARKAEAVAELLGEPAPGAKHQPATAPAATSGVPTGRASPAQDKVVALIRRKPDAVYDDLARELRGNTSQSAHEAARVMVSKMKKLGRLEGKPGNWRVLK